MKGVVIILWSNELRKLKQLTSMRFGYPERITSSMVKLNYLTGKFKLKKLI